MPLMLRTDKKFQKIVDDIFKRQPQKITTENDPHEKTNKEKRLNFEETLRVR